LDGSNLFQDSDDDDLDVRELGVNQNEENIAEEKDVNHVNQHQDYDMLKNADLKNHRDRWMIG
jgi:hypothetical protein